MRNAVADVDFDVYRTGIDSHHGRTLHGCEHVGKCKRAARTGSKETGLFPRVRVGSIAETATPEPRRIAIFEALRLPLQVLLDGGDILSDMLDALFGKRHAPTKSSNKTNCRPSSRRRAKSARALSAMLTQMAVRTSKLAQTARRSTRSARRPSAR